ncbi:hypothetical protein FHS72_001347 [Loktanella ponticola]|uniref:Transferrin-binding protein B C-lobe/N-lobe beta barrel domain-containing protein n=1 Tax=Yoonia ponticola TaxID=1524255 RepID=A0A7W9EZ26_9RHOB|nr:hypothetical protein [Yoonia ponticola]MBB5721735.1 hypothetical protein [Yoonia ponticola]
MNFIKTLIAGTGLFAVAACGGSNSGSDEFVVSSGVLEEVELPSGDDYAELPSVLKGLVNEFKDLNELNVATVTVPSGSADYSGVLGFGVDDDAYLSGDLAMTANFDDLTFNGTYSNITGQSDEGEALTVIGSVPVATTIRNNGDKVTFDGAAVGDVTLAGAAYRFDANIDGAFGGTDGEVALAQVSGNIYDYAEQEYEEIDGLAMLEQD